MLERVSKYLGKEHQTHRQVRGALMYPVFMMFMAVGVTVFLLAFVLPRFATIYASRHAALPGPTRLLLAVSNGLVNYWYVWLGLAIALLVGGIIAWRTDSGRRAIDWLKLNTPIFGHLFTQLYVTRACRVMGTMIGAGVPMLDAVGIAKQVTRNAYYEDLWDQVDKALQQGLQLSDPLFKSTLVPRSVAQMIRSGEKSGRLGQVMNRIAEYSEQEFDEAVKTTTQFIEPAMVVFMGGLIGFVAISLLLPIFTVSKVAAGG
jgi:type IV pilus assembly protein PilC